MLTSLKFVGQVSRILESCLRQEGFDDYGNFQSTEVLGVCGKGERPAAVQDSPQAVSLSISDRNQRAISVCHPRSEEHTSELQSLRHLVCRLLPGKSTAGRPRMATTATARDSSRRSCGAFGA